MLDRARLPPRWGELALTRPWRDDSNPNLVERASYFLRHYLWCNHAYQEALAILPAGSTCTAPRVTTLPPGGLFFFFNAGQKANEYAALCRLDSGMLIPERIRVVRAYCEQPRGPPAAADLGKWRPWYVAWVPLELAGQLSSHAVMLQGEPYALVRVDLMVERDQASVEGFSAKYCWRQVLEAGSSQHLNGPREGDEDVAGDAGESARRRAAAAAKEAELDAVLEGRAYETGLPPFIDAFPPDHAPEMQWKRDALPFARIAPPPLEPLISAQGTRLGRWVDKRRCPPAWSDPTGRKPWRDRSRPLRERAALYLRYCTAVSTHRHPRAGVLPRGTKGADDIRIESMQQWLYGLHHDRSDADRADASHRDNPTGQ